MSPEKTSRGLRHIFVMLLFFFCALPSVVFACSHETIEKLLGHNLNMRLQFIRNENRMSIYEHAVLQNKMRAQEMFSRNDLAGVCKEVFGMIAVADDVLAGGNGRSLPLKTPWGKCTPERMFALIDEYEAICIPSYTSYIANCARRSLQPLRREMAKLKAWAGAGRADVKEERYVARMCELYTEMLTIIRKK